LYQDNGHTSKSFEIICGDVRAVTRGEIWGTHSPTHGHAHGVGNHSDTNSAAASNKKKSTAIAGSKRSAWLEEANKAIDNKQK